MFYALPRSLCDTRGEVGCPFLAALAYFLTWATHPNIPGGTGWEHSEPFSGMWEQQACDARSDERKKWEDSHTGCFVYSCQPQRSLQMPPQLELIFSICWESRWIQSCLFVLVFFLFSASLCFVSPPSSLLWEQIVYEMKKKTCCLWVRSMNIQKLNVTHLGGKALHSRT